MIKILFVCHGNIWWFFREARKIKSCRTLRFENTPFVHLSIFVSMLWMMKNGCGMAIIKLNKSGWNTLILKRLITTQQTQAGLSRWPWWCGRLDRNGWVCYYKTVRILRYVKCRILKKVFAFRNIIILVVCGVLWSITQL